MWDAGAIALIVAYQRYVSPHKGYRCAHRARTGRASCSEFARRAIARRGVLRGIALARLHFRACAESAAILAATRDEDAGRRAQRCLIDAAQGAECLGCCADGALACPGW